MFANVLSGILPDRMRPAAYLAASPGARGGGRVASGPFRGMKYNLEAVGSTLVPKLLGNLPRASFTG